MFYQKDKYYRDYFLKQKNLEAAECAENWTLKECV